jgi:hypothetical protein
VGDAETSLQLQTATVEFGESRVEVADSVDENRSLPSEVIG